MPNEPKAEKLKLSSITLTNKTTFFGMPLETIKQGSNGISITMAGKHAMIRREGYPGVEEVYPDAIAKVSWAPESEQS